MLKMIKKTVNLINAKLKKKCFRQRRRRMRFCKNNIKEKKI